MAWPLSCLMVFYLALILLLQSSPSYSQNSGKFSVGQSLLAKDNGTSVVSPSGDFALGFHQAPNNSDLYLLSIWYATIPDTIVWYANGVYPVPQGSTLNLTVDEGLVLSNPQGAVLWSTTDALSGGGAVSYGFINDTGNFALISSVNAAPLWQTFDYPTDTLLPTQTLETVNNVISRISGNNLTQGRFQLHFDDGDLVLNTRDVASGYEYNSYYKSDGTGTNGQKLVYSESGDMFILLRNGSRVDLIQSGGLRSAKDYYQNHTNTAVRGTKGYLAPEWFKNKPVSVKVDVYSFGVLLLEIICCRKCVCINVSTDECDILTDLAFDCYQSGTLDSLVKDDMEALNDRPQLERLVKVALWCIQENPELRPTMKRVTLMLEGVADVPSPPCPTSFSASLPG